MTEPAIMESMKFAQATDGGGIQSITIGRKPVPKPVDGEALVRLKVATLNYRDLLTLQGGLPGIKNPHYVPLSDAVGEVVAVGTGVARVRPGDRVTPLFSQGWLSGPTPAMTMLGGPIDGVASQYAVFDAESLCHIPDTIGDLEAATLPCAGITAWSAVFGPRPIQANEWVLVQGTGGVSMAALQWAKAAGAKVVVTSSSDAKLRRALSLGADVVINYCMTPDWASAAIEARGGKGMDLVVDVVGEGQIEQCIRAVGRRGAISAVGRLSGERSWKTESKVPIHPIVVGNREQHEAMIAYCAKHGIRPVVDAVYDLERLADAMKVLKSGNFFGKIAINLL